MAASQEVPRGARAVEGGDIIIVSSAYGSQGDVGPLLALARTLRRRADADAAARPVTTVVFVGNGYFREEVEASGLHFVGVGSKEGYEDLLANSQKRRDKRALVRYWLSHLEAHYAALEGLVRGRRRAVVVAHPLVRASLVS